MCIARMSSQGHQIDQLANLNPQNQDDLFFFNAGPNVVDETSDDVNENQAGDGVDSIQTVEPVGTQILLTSASHELALTAPSMNTGLDGISNSEDPSSADAVNEDNPNVMLKNNTDSDLQTNPLNTPETGFSLGGVFQRIGAKLRALFSFGARRSEVARQKDKKVEEDQEVEIKRVNERQVGQQSEVLKKIISKLPRSLSDKLTKFENEKKIIEALSNATVRYQAVISSSARRYSNLTVEQKTDCALQEGARVISTALNSLK